MTAEEKAKELVSQFKKYAYYPQTEDDEIFVMELNKNAKKCALICVKELLKTYPITYGTGINGEFYIDSITIKSYWEKVKNEIEKL